MSRSLTWLPQRGAPQSAFYTARRLPVFHLARTFLITRYKGDNQAQLQFIREIVCINKSLAQQLQREFLSYISINVPFRNLAAMLRARHPSAIIDPPPSLLFSFLLSSLCSLLSRFERGNIHVHFPERLSHIVPERCRRRAGHRQLSLYTLISLITHIIITI